MHASRSFVAGVTIVFLCVSIAATYPTTGVINVDVLPKKCCLTDYAFNENLECVHVQPDKFNYVTRNTWKTVPQHPRQIVKVIALVQGLSCRDDASTSDHHLLRTYARNSYVPKEYCIERMVNGTTVLAKCPGSGTELAMDKDDSAGMMVMSKTTITTVTTITVMTIMTTSTTTTTVITMNASSNTSSTNVSSVQDDKGVIHCRLRGLRAVIFWGAQTYMDTNVAHVVLCTIVVVVYLSVPDLGKSIYNRAVLRHNVCLLLLGCILTLLGFCELCECPISDNLAAFLWIALQYFTNATGFWLNVICFDMTLSITRFRWIPGSGQRTNREEKRLLLYSAFVWGCALIPAVVALILEYCPGIPEDFPLKPNYRRYRDGPNVVVNLYFFGLPLLTLFWNNVLFVFTTYKIVRIQRSTEIATRNHTNALKKKYFLFLQLYLLMGAPWFFGLLFACLNNLVILKICRLIQPVLWLLMLPTHKKLRQTITSKLRCVKRRKDNTISS